MSKVLPTTERADITLLLDKVPLTSLEMNAPKEAVCVTGATGYVGAHVVRRLLRIGHTVHAPIRNPDDKKKVDGLMAMPGASELLKIYKADLMEAGSYDEAMVGCSTVIHVASPWFMVGNKKFVKEKLLDPALTGTENIMASCSRTPTVKKLVVTGTIWTVCADYRPYKQQPDFVVNEEAREEGCSETDFPYAYSKVLAEKRLEELAAAQSQFEVINLCQGATFGPPATKRGQGVSCMSMKYMRLGLFFPMVPDIEFPMIDVRDAAACHCMAMASPKAKGRYVTVARMCSFYEFGATLRKDWRTFKFLTPYFKAPFFMKTPFSIGFPILGFEGSLVKRKWGMKVNLDNSKIAADLDFEAQGFEWQSTKSFVVDMDLSFQKFGIWSMSGTVNKRTINGK